MGITWLKHHSPDGWLLDITIGANRRQVLFDTERKANEFIAGELASGNICLAPRTAVEDVACADEGIALLIQRRPC